MSATTASAPRGLRRSGRALVASQVRYDGLSFVRNRQGRFFTLALPILFLVLLCSIFGNDTVRVPGGSVKESTYYVPGLVALGRVLSAEQIKVAFAPNGGEGQTRVTISGKAGRGGEAVADEEFWTEVLNAR